MAVEVAYPLSENTVLVILQLSCNACSALFIDLATKTKYVCRTALRGDFGGVSAFPTKYWSRCRCFAMWERTK